MIAWSTQQREPEDPPKPTPKPSPKHTPRWARKRRKVASARGVHELKLGKLWLRGAPRTTLMVKRSLWSQLPAECRLSRIAAHRSIQAAGYINRTATPLGEASVKSRRAPALPDLPPSCSSVLFKICTSGYRAHPCTTMSCKDSHKVSNFSIYRNNMCIYIYMYMYMYRERERANPSP